MILISTEIYFSDDELLGLGLDEKAYAEILKKNTNFTLTEMLC
jgi:hypothetical protein